MGATQTRATNSGHACDPPRLDDTNPTKSHISGGAMRLGRAGVRLRRETPHKSPFAPKI